jgi:dihydrodipicolinate synthase/N-acetylneuraminate lyase
MVDEAHRGGADGVLVITPTTLTRGRLGYVEAFYRQVAYRSPLPVLLYSVPSVTAFELPEELVLGLADHDNIVGMKDSGGHPVRVQRLAASAPERFLIFNGSTQAVTLAITAGAYGAITASTNYLPQKMLALVETARRAPLRARPLQAEMSMAAAAVETHGIPGVKAAASISGLISGHPRLPLIALRRAASDRLARQWREFIVGS